VIPTPPPGGVPTGSEGAGPGVPPPPEGVTRPAALVLDEPALASYWQKIRRILFRRTILRGVRKIDPRTGMTVR